MSYPLRKALQAAVYYLLDRPFYILDELDSALTYQSTLSIIAHLRRNGAGILLITHDRQFADKVAQRSYTIKEGRLIAV
jgi:energy-coupling factor transport system ATP-binding protein